MKLDLDIMRRPAYQAGCFSVGSLGYETTIRATNWHEFAYAYYTKLCVSLLPTHREEARLSVISRSTGAYWPWRRSGFRKRILLKLLRFC